MKKIVLAISFIAIILLCWYWVSSFDEKYKFVFSDPVCVFKAFTVNKQLILDHSLITLVEMLLAVGLSLLISIPIAFSMYSVPQVGSVVQGSFLVLKSLPSFAISPLIVFAVGFSKAAVLVPAVLMLLFPITIGLYRGLMATPVAVLEMYTCWQASVVQTFFAVRIPYALPHFFSGLRVALGLVGTAVLAGEWVSSQEGLGFLLLEAKEGVDIAFMYAIIITLFCLSASFYLLGIAIENGVFKRLKLASTLCLLIMLTGCSSNEKTTLMLDWTPNPNHVVIYSGVKKGFFQEEGIDLEVLAPGSLDALQAVACGQVDACCARLPRYLRACDKGANLTILGVVIDKVLNGLLMAGDKTIQDLQGARIGLCGTCESKTCRRLLQSHNLEARSWIRMNMDPFAMLESGKLDAVWGMYYNIQRICAL